MQRIDAHQHFWKFDPVRDNWINSDMSVIARDFLPNDLLPLLERNNIDGTVVVQTCHMDEDNHFMLELADQYSFIKGVVGWVNLQSIKVEDKLKYYHERYPKMKGFRHVLQSDPDDQLMLRDSFTNGISLLNKYNFTYDILIYPKHLKYAAQLAAEFPDQKFVVDHLAKPHIKTKEIDSWKRDIEALSKHLNVYCKVSGMLTEADWYSWKTEDFMPYLDTVFNAFSINRVIYGSDWPVCKLAGGYNRALEILQIYTSRFSEREQAQFYGGNAIEFYNLTE
ncbi:amidohydrolase [Mucilaginibacter sp. BT774]|uniref:amidohydrolase family protein n=1 Tax=Mucilaginibacter sp. BT774 TaxID=3062276 RepID=UPI00267504E6|nr:amidohydrolase family protein [Mucilaginibacter sp. BT774]MDO3624791.1 amidohydrolase family protein [Mucilaginibacter sp. BT774]